MIVNGLIMVAKLERCVLDLTVSQLTVTLLLFVFLEYSHIIMYEYASIIHNLSIYYVNYNDTCFL
jgi:hypothetical protein